MGACSHACKLFLRGAGACITTATNGASGVEATGRRCGAGTPPAGTSVPAGAPQRWRCVGHGRWRQEAVGEQGGTWGVVLHVLRLQDGRAPGAQLLDAGVVSRVRSAEGARHVAAGSLQAPPVGAHPRGQGRHGGGQAQRRPGSWQTGGQGTGRGHGYGGQERPGSGAGSPGAALGGGDLRRLGCPTARGRDSRAPGRGRRGQEAGHHPVEGRGHLRALSAAAPPTPPNSGRSTTSLPKPRPSRPPRTSRSCRPRSRTPGSC